MPTCKAVRIHRFGGPEVLQLDQVPIPRPADDEVLIRIHAAGINPVDYKIRDGSFPIIRQDQLPIILGRDAAGIVETVGSAVQNLKPGDPVFAFLPLDRGGYTEFQAIKAADAVTKPQRLDHIHAAAVPLAAMTAWQGLFDHGHLQSGQRVLIHGGAGGVGHFAIQFAKAAGATVFTTASARDLGFVRDLGADETIDYQAQRFEDVARDIDLVLDLIGGETQQRSWSVLKPGGALISTLQKPDEAGANQRDIRAANFMAQLNPVQLRDIAALIDGEKVHPQVTAIFHLDRVGDAHEALEHDHPRGKIVLSMA